MRSSNSVFTLVALGFALSGMACAQPAPRPKAPEIKYYEFTGIVTAIDTSALAITVAKGGQTETFSVDGNTTIKLKRGYTLVQVPVKSKVFVRYKGADGKKLAVRVQIIKLGRGIKAAR